MARGWESKAIESQQDEAQWRAAQKPARSAEDLEKASRRTTLEMALAQTQAELRAACRPAHRDMLRLRLTAIQDQLAALA